MWRPRVADAARIEPDDHPPDNRLAAPLAAGVTAVCGIFDIEVVAGPRVELRTALPRTLARETRPAVAA